MKASPTLAFLLCLPVALLANPGAPQVSNVALHKPASGTAVVTFDLDEDAIVTAQFVADGVPVADEIVRTISGDVNRKVSAGTGRSFTWKARKDWPDHLVANFSVTVTAWPPLAPPDYMAVDLRADAETPRIRYYASSNAVPGGVTNRIYKSDYLLMRRIPAAMVRHRQGSPATATVRANNETAHYCTLSEDYYMAVYEFTEAQFALVGGSRTKTTSFDVADGEDARYYPLTGVYWYNNVRSDGHSVARTDPPNPNSILGKLNTRAGVSTFDLPTDAQWEYACRAGTETAFSDGRDSSSSTDYSDIAVYNASAPLRVGSKAPNAWGLYDMHGNMAEWCLDNIESRELTTNSVGTVTESAGYYARDAHDPAGRNYIGKCVVRGGGYNTTSAKIRSAFRNANLWWGSQSANIGFRVMCPISKW